MGETTKRLLATCETCQSANHSPRKPPHSQLPAVQTENYGTTSTNDPEQVDMRGSTGRHGVDTQVDTRVDTPQADIPLNPVTQLNNENTKGNTHGQGYNSIEESNTPVKCIPIDPKPVYDEERGNVFS